MVSNKFNPLTELAKRSVQARSVTGPSTDSTWQSDPESDLLEYIKEYVLQHYGPTVRHDGLLEITSIGRSNSYVLKKIDPTFPEGTPLYSGKNSPKWYWTHEVLEWLIARRNTFRNQQKGN